MAAVVTVETVRQTASKAALRTGEQLHRQGAVRECAAADGGAAGGVVAQGARHSVWVGVVDRRLTGTCDCGSRSAFCAHAVALALAAMHDGIDWAPAPQRDPDRADAAATFRALSAAERGGVLDALLAERPELRAEAQRLALALLSPTGTSRSTPDAASTALSDLRRRWPESTESYGDDYASYAERPQTDACTYTEAGATRVHIVKPTLASYEEFAAGEGLPVDDAGTRRTYSRHVLRDRPEQAPVWPPPRNGPCWCESGRKYKKCCGSPARN